MVKDVSLKVRCVTKPGNKHSFQFVSDEGKVVFMPPTWWDSKEQAEEVAALLRRRFITRLTDANIKVNENKDGTINTSIDEDNPLFKFAEEKIKSSINDGQREDIAETLRRIKREHKYAIIMAVAIHRKTDKKGIVLIDSDNEMLMQPQEWYDSVEEAHKATFGSTSFIKTIITELEKKGPRNVTFIDAVYGEVITPDDVINHLKKTGNNEAAKWMNDNEDKMEPDDKYPWRINIDPLLN